MTILLHAVMKFSTPPDDTDVKVIMALKKYWSTMMIRVSLFLVAFAVRHLQPSRSY
jgi:hypothetical protein